VSAYTLVLNHVPINATIIGTHEHESHYVYDLLHNNTADIKPERHSTGTHGTNQVNFWLLRVFGYQFAPRYRDLHKKIDGLVGFKRRKHSADYLIKPERKAYDDCFTPQRACVSPHVDCSLSRRSTALTALDPNPLEKFRACLPQRAYNRPAPRPM